MNGTKNATERTPSMQSRGMLMKEHRLIERMIALARAELERLDEGGKLAPRFVDRLTDFMRTYADMTHHGKEEDILFRELGGRSLSPDHRRAMEELRGEHVTARRVVGSVSDANARYRSGQDSAADEVRRGLRRMVQLYPEHIRREDEDFFPAAMEYLEEGEDARLLEEFREFDREVMHEHYRRVVEELEDR